MPLDTSDFPDEVQVAFFIFTLLEDNWDGMSGTYLGKHWSSLEYFFDLHKVEEKVVTLRIMKMYESMLINHRAEKAEQKRKAEERKRKSSGGGKNYTHNIRR